MAKNERAILDLIINGQQSKASLKEIGLEATRTRSALLKMREADDPAAYKQKLADYKALTAAQKEMRARIDDTSTAFSRFKSNMASTMAGVVGGNVITSALQSLIGLIPSAIERTLKLKDSFADIQKSTGLSAQGVKQLNDELRNLDTRTPTEDLRNIAVVGGQLGVANEELVDFIKNADKATVALGDEFTGGVEEVAKELGGIAKLFDETRSQPIGKSINEIGSAINELGAAGSATGPVVAEFTTRMGQLGNLAPKLHETLGLGAAMQELGLTAEIAASGLSGLMVTAASKSDLFAQHLGMSQKALEQLINTDPNKFLMTLAQSFQGLSATQVAQRLKELKVESQESIKVMSLLAEQTDLVQEKQKLAAKAIAEGTSLTAEFDKKNLQLARDLKTLNEWFDNLLTSEGIQNFLSGAVHGVVEFIRVLPQLGQWLASNKSLFLLLASATLVYYGNLVKATVAAVANTTAELARKAAYELGFRWLIISEAATKAYALATGVLTGQISLQTAALTLGRRAWAALNAIMIANPVGVVVAAVTALAYAVKLYSDNTEAAIRLEREKVRLQRDMQLLNELQSKVLTELNEKLQDYTQMTTVERAEFVKNIAVARLDLESRLARMKAREKEMEMLAAEPTLWQQLWIAIKSMGDPAKMAQNVTQQVAENMVGVREQFAAGIQGLEADLKQYDGILKQVGRYEKPTPSGSGKLNTIVDPEDAKRQANKQKNDTKRDADELERMLSDARERTMKGEKSQYENEVAAFADKYSQMYELAKDNEAKINEIRTLSLAEWSEIEKRFYDKQKIDKKKELDNTQKLALDQLENKKQTKIDDLTIDKASGRITDTQFEGKQLDQEQAYLLAKYKLYEDHYRQIEALGIKDKDELARLAKEKKDVQTQIEQELTDNVTKQIEQRIRQSDEFMQKSIDNERRRKEAIAGIVNDLLSVMQVNWDEQLKGLKEFWEKSSLIQKAAFIAQKAYAVAEATVGYARTLMSIWANSGSPWAAVGFTGLATATYATVLAKIASANYATPAFADGGFTGLEDGPAGYVDKPTLFTMGQRQYVAGEAGREFVISNRALQDPIVADFTRMLDVAQKTGNYSQLGAGAGTNLNGSAFGIGRDTKQASNLSSDTLLLSLIREQQLTRSALSDLAKRPIYQNYRLRKQYDDNIQQIRDTNKL